MLLLFPTGIRLSDWMFCIKEDKEWFNHFHFVKLYPVLVISNPSLSSATLSWDFILKHVLEIPQHWLVGPVYAVQKQWIVLQAWLVHGGTGGEIKVVPICKKERWKCKDFWPHTRQNGWIVLCFQTCHPVLPQSLPRYFCGVFAFYLSVVLVCPCPNSTLWLLPECQAEGQQDVERMALCTRHLRA